MFELSKAQVYHTVEGMKKIVMSDIDYKELMNYLEVADDLLRRVKLTIYAEQNALIHFSYEDQKTPALENFGIILRNGRMEKNLWFKYKDVVKKLYEEGEKNGN